MSEFTTTATAQTTIDLISEEEARQARVHSFLESEQAVSLEAEMHVDSTQLLALGLVSYDQVFEASVRIAKTENDYSIGRWFDVFNSKGIRYGEHVLNVTKGLKPEDIVSDGLVYSNKYSVAREQISINSELKVEKHTGLMYFEITRRWQYVSSGNYSSQKFASRKFNTPRVLKLYVRSMEEQTFFFRENGKEVTVALGSPMVYDAISSQIKGSGVVARYEEALNDLDQDTREWLTENDNNQKLFLTVFKQILPELKAARKAAQAAAQQ